MLQRLVEKIVAWLIRNKVVNPEDRELYEYAAFNCIFVLLPFLVIIPFCFITKTLINGIVFTISFFCIRRTGGGYHAKSPMKCWLYSCTVVMILVYGSSMMKNEYILQILFFMMLVCVWFLCPVETENHKLSAGERVKHRMQCRFAEIMLMILFCILTIIQQNVLAVSLSLGVCFAGSLQIIGFVENKLLAKMNS